MDVPALVPRPVDLRPAAGVFRLPPDATLAGPPPVLRLARRLLGTATGFPLPDGGEGATIRLDLVGAAGDGEAYHLEVGLEGIRISAGAEAGLADGLHTLVQLLPVDILRPAVVRDMAWDVPHLEIDDAPRFAWRGAHLDVARHFLPAHWLFRFVELLALHKLNVLHLHLNDDQGWRFPSERYPRLVELGSWRRATPVGFQGEDGFELTPHGGSYTRRELVDLVAFAAERNVTVVPEIDFPGHAGAILAAYPDLGNGTGPYETWTRWGINRQVLNLEPATVRFCTDVLGEVADLFPSPFLHIGGDEVPKDEWRSSARAQQRRAELGLESEEQLQHWFTAQLHAFLRERGRRLIGWDEILEGGLPPEGAVVMSWRGVGGGVTAAHAGLDVVMCPEKPLYLDHYQSDDPDEPLAITGRNTLADVCAFDPIVDGLDGPAAERVLGSQVQLWTEYMPDPRAVEYMAFPRSVDFADAVWVPAGGDPAEREARVLAHLERLDVLGVDYRPPIGPHPWQRGGEGRRRRQGPPGEANPRKS